MHCVKSVPIWSFSGPYFLAFGLNTERYSVSLRIQSECGKMRTRKTSNKDTFHAVMVTLIFYNLRSGRTASTKEHVKSQQVHQKSIRMFLNDENIKAKFKKTKKRRH